MAEDKSIVQRLLDPKLYQQSDLVLGVGVVTILAMLVIPLPAFMLDLFIAMNLMLALVVLLTVMYTSNSSDFSVFPSLLLISTMFRLAINVSSTRLILTEGTQFDGKIIQTFGEFVVAGNYVVGFIIFIILIAVQFVVITKGATRVAEVAARFTLDALPGKQMAIDAEYNNGRISEDEARQRRQALDKEVDFYGAMDGASKFVSGDVKVGILITLVNIIGGFVIGMAIHGESFQVAVDTYIKLTIGDGLSSQIPSLLITTATGIIVTRSISEKPLGEDLSQQLSSEPRALWVASGTLLFSTIIPGFPKAPLFILGVGIGLLAFQLQRARQTETQQEAEKQQKEEETQKRAPEDFSSLTRVEPLEVEIGFSLIPLADPQKGGNLLENITSLRKRIAMSAGLLVPPIRIHDNIDLQSNHYSIKIRGIEYGNASLEADKLLALDHGNVTQKMEGLEAVDPAYGSPAVWIGPDQRKEAETRGYIVVDPKTVLITHLEYIILKNAAHILGRQEVRKLMDNMAEDNPALVEDLKAHPSYNTGIVQKVLQGLLREGISIRNLLTILESILSGLDYTTIPRQLTEHVRSALAAQISNELMVNNKLYVITIDPAIERALQSAISEDPIEGYVLNLEPDTQSRLLEIFAEQVQGVRSQGHYPVFVITPLLRPLVFDLLARDIPDVTVISYNEIAPATEVEAIATVQAPNQAQAVSTV